MRIGLHPHLIPEKAPEWLSRLRTTFDTVLTDGEGGNDASYYIPRFDNPNKEYLVRLYDPNSMGHDPIELAGLMDNAIRAVSARTGVPLTRLIAQSYNELNLGIEHQEPWVAWDTDEKFQERLKWMLPHHRRLRELSAGAYRISGPSDSPGHQDVDGRQEVRLYAEAGLFDLVDCFGGHYYARGLTEGVPGGYDAADKEWFSDRVLKVRDMLDGLGYGWLPIIVGETNRKDCFEGDILGEFDRYCARIAGAVDALSWFVWSSTDAGFSTMQMCLVVDDEQSLSSFQGIIDRYAAGAPEPVPPDPDPGPTPPVDEATRALAAKYALSIVTAPGVGVRLTEDTTGQMELTADAPAGVAVTLHTTDGQNVSSGLGHAGVIMASTSAYWPPQPGPWQAQAGGAIVSGLGWLGGTNHHHCDVAFVPVANPVPEPEPPQPGYAWHGAFREFAAAHPAVGTPIGPPAYLPDDFVTCAQVSRTHILCWTGASVVPVRREGG